jgi:hypothetical protein
VIRRAAALAVGILFLALAASPATASAAADAPRARNVFVFSVPNVSWADLLDAPSNQAFRVFFERAAVAALTTRAVERRTTNADGYVSLGAGTRSVSDPMTDGDGLMTDEVFGTTTAGDAFRQRTGRDPSGAVVQVGIRPIIDANARLHYDSEVGALADALERAQIGRAVIANADGREPDAGRVPDDATPGPPRQRQAVLGVMDSHGEVPAGTVDPAQLLVDEPRFAFGVRTDADEVLGRFDTVFEDRSVVLVEASDLARADRYRPYASGAERRRQLDLAIGAANSLFGQLLEKVDTTRDVVILVGPAHSQHGVTLTPLAIRGPEFTPGLLTSATTRRSGFVQIQDLAPTILTSLGVDVPTSMEGEAAENGRTAGSATERLQFLRDADAAAQFRDDRVGEVYALLVVAVGLTVALCFVAAARPRERGWRAAAGYTAFATLGLIPTTFLARLVPFQDHGAGAYYGFLLAVALALGGGYSLVARRHAIEHPMDGVVDGVITALLVIVGLLTIDALRGAPLVLNSALGYSPTVAGRFAGFGNPAYAAYSASALLAACLLAHRVGGRRGFGIAAALLGLALVVDVAPMWGSDVGGILSMVPAYAVTLVLLAGRRIRIRTVVLIAAAMAVVGAIAAAIDLSRPREDRTHLGRYLTRIQDRGIGEGWSVIQRKLDANLASLGTGILGLVLLATAILFLGLWMWRRSWLGTVFHRVPEWRAACIGFAVLAVLGFAFNDSGITVPGIMLVVFVATWVRLLVAVASDDEPAPPPPDDSGAAPDDRVLVPA